MVEALSSLSQLPFLSLFGDLLEHSVYHAEFFFFFCKSLSILLLLFFKLLKKIFFKEHKL